MHEIRAELTATVWKLCAEVGQLIAEGDDILVLESMKMEIPVATEVPGVLRELFVSEGSTVNEGELLALVDES